MVAATPMELEGAGEGGRVCGVGPQEAARSVAELIAAEHPDGVLHVGIAGTRRGCGIGLLDVVIGTAAVDCDGGGPDVAAEPRLLTTARAAFPSAPAIRIGTSARVGGTSAVDVEAMEGYAVLAACRAAGVPAVEIRVVSNEIDEPDRAKWRFDDAFAEVARVTGILLPEVAACLR